MSFQLIILTNKLSAFQSDRGFNSSSASCNAWDIAFVSNMYCKHSDEITIAAHKHRYCFTDIALHKRVLSNNINNTTNVAFVIERTSYIHHWWHRTILQGLDRIKKWETDSTTNHSINRALLEHQRQYSSETLLVNYAYLLWGCRWFSVFVSSFCYA